MGKIIKDSASEKIKNHSFTVLKKGEKGTKSFEVKTFSKVEKGTKSFKFQKFEDLIKQEKDNKPKIINKQNKTENNNPETHRKTLTEDEIEKTIKEAVEKARKIALDEGYKKGFEEAKSTFDKKYEAEKEDYLQKIEELSNKAINEIQSLKNLLETFDKDIPELVLKFVKEIIGSERKINDEIIISLIKENLSKLNDFEDIIFIINPIDEDIVKEKFTHYKIETDPNIHKGSFKVKTKLGDIDFNIDNLIEQLELSINEKFKSS